MTGADLQGQVKRVVNDVSFAWTDQQYLEAINASIVLVATFMEKQNDPDLLVTESFANGSEVPEYFIRFAGEIPVRQVNGRFMHASATPLDIDFFKMPASLLSLGDNIPFRSRANIEALKLATATYLKEQRGTFDMKNEKIEWACY